MFTAESQQGLHSSRAPASRQRGLTFCIRITPLLACDDEKGAGAKEAEKKRQQPQDTVKDVSKYTQHRRSSVIFVLMGDFSLMSRPVLGVLKVHLRDCRQCAPV